MSREARYDTVTEMLSADVAADTEKRVSTNDTAGFVHLLRFGKSFKIGRTTATGRAYVSWRSNCLRSRTQYM